MDDDDDDDGKGGKQGKSINDSMSEHKCILTSNIIYSFTIYHTNTLASRGLRWRNLFSSCAVGSVYCFGGK